ncbi:MAG: MFS transporter [Alphaproteobacteria bacterium]|nr:MFS transporter [Alphaproteobacteria bacterium]
MINALSAIAALLLAAAILLVGNGLQATLLSVRGGIEGFPTPVIGALMACYFTGYILGCRFNPQFIKSVGHIRTFVALASIASASALTHPFIVNEIAWGLLRGVTGFCFAGLVMIIESWLNERATNADRGRIMSTYRVVDLSATVTGNALLATASPEGFELFALTSIMISIALVPVALTRSPAPQPIATARLNIPKLFKVSRVAAVGAAATGLANSSFWALGPVYAQQLGYPKAVIAAFMSCVVIGAALLQWPIGWLSDKVDRRIVMVGSGVLGVAAALALSHFGAKGEAYLLGIGAAFGAFIIPMFGLNAAHANDHAEPGSAVETNGGLLLLHASGAVIGSFAGGFAMSAYGPSAIFVYIAVIYSAFCVFALARILTREAPVADEKTPFSPVPRSASPAVFEIAEDDPNEERSAQNAPSERAASAADV